LNPRPWKVLSRLFTVDCLQSIVYSPQTNFSCCSHLLTFKLSCDSRFQLAFTACSCVFKEITLVGSNHGNYFKTQLHAVNARWKRVSQRSFQRLTFFETFFVDLNALDCNWKNHYFLNFYWNKNNLDRIWFIEKWFWSKNSNYYIFNKKSIISWLPVPIFYFYHMLSRWISISRWGRNQVSISPTCLNLAFMIQDPKSAKNTIKSSVSFFALLGSMPAKAACKTLVKLTQITLCFKVLNANYRIILI